MNSVVLKAPAKLNLTLEVFGVRGDGYHGISSIMQTVDLCDVLVLKKADRVTLSCNRPDLEVPDNLAFKAACALQKITRKGFGVQIELEKKIPVSAGLGGGSSDAAAVLLGLNKLWGLGFSLDDLSVIGSQLGSDVPFFLQGGTAMVQGRGENVIPLPPASVEWFLVLSPPFQIEEKTSKTYSMLSQSDLADGIFTRQLESRIRMGEIVEAQALFNSFDKVAQTAFPGLEEYWHRFELLVGPKGVHLTGSGPSLFALISKKDCGKAIELVLREHYGLAAYLVSAVWPQSGLK